MRVLPKEIGQQRRKRNIIEMEEELQEKKILNVFEKNDDDIEERLEEMGIKGERKLVKDENEKKSII